ncbi:endolytic transglycosylase MltG [Pacificispira sp.]|uniref:endolytic transglycosylase MltG n=1 Tax=Pacificispira sp. TaxID=2888761 RepID=UPI002EA85546|nr:endolytic transglycosylase MltG [Pseudomonadota bacterium]
MTERNSDQTEDAAAGGEAETPPPRKRPATRILRRALISFLFLILLTGGGAAWLFHWAQTVHRQAGPLTADTTVVIEPGSGLQRIARNLAESGVIDHPEVFIAMLRYSGDHTRLKAGEYRFEAGLSQAEVAGKLIEHDVLVHFLTVPEGLTVAEVLEIVATADGLTGEMPAPPEEGSLLPETYQYRRGDTRADVLGRMQASMDAALMDLWEGRAENLPVSTPREALILASIVEKETGVAAERARVAAVFVNRLRRGMRLQSDPTVVYALTGGQAPLGRALTRQDWKVDNPYNTYRVDGLPPGPIANPGRLTLQATLNPAETKELYFVADGTGGHAFAETLAQHNRNVAKWRKIRSQTD